MTTKFNRFQIAWASQHDWFAFATADAIYAWNQLSDGTCTMEKITSFEALRDWARY